MAGPGASYLMALFTHVSRDRPSRFSDGSFGVLYAANSFEVALFETIFHHERFMARTNEARGWTSHFREIVLTVDARLDDLRSDPAFRHILDPWSYAASQPFGAALRSAGSNGVVYPSVRWAGGECVGLFHRTAPKARSRADTWTITGTASELTCIASSARTTNHGSFASSMTGSGASFLSRFKRHGGQS